MMVDESAHSLRVEAVRRRSEDTSDIEVSWTVLNTVRGGGYMIRDRSWPICYVISQGK